MSLSSSTLSPWFIPTLRLAKVLGSSHGHDLISGPRRNTLAYEKSDAYRANPRNLELLDCLIIIYCISTDLYLESYGVVK